MSRPFVGTTTVSSAGTRVQLSNTVDRVLGYNIKALAGNGNKVYFGTSNVSATNGYELSAGNTITREYRNSVKISSFYVDSATNGDKICWEFELE